MASNLHLLSKFFFFLTVSCNYLILIGTIQLHLFHLHEKTKSWKENIYDLLLMKMNV